MELGRYALGDWGLATYCHASRGSASFRGWYVCLPVCLSTCLPVQLFLALFAHHPPLSSPRSQIRALTDVKGRACSVKPCLDMRHALGLLDFEDESIDGKLANFITMDGRTPGFWGFMVFWILGCQDSGVYL